MGRVRMGWGWQGDNGLGMLAGVGNLGQSWKALMTGGGLGDSDK